MNIFLIIIGALISLFCGIFAFSSQSILKNQKVWDEFYTKVKEEQMDLPEEIVYQAVSKINFWMSLFTIIGIICLVSGILLATLK